MKKNLFTRYINWKRAYSKNRHFRLLKRVLPPHKSNRHTPIDDNWLKDGMLHDGSNNDDFKDAGSLLNQIQHEYYPHRLTKRVIKIRLDQLYNMHYNVAGNDNISQVLMHWIDIGHGELRSRASSTLSIVAITIALTTLIYSVATRQTSPKEVQNQKAKTHINIGPVFRELQK